MKAFARVFSFDIVSKGALGLIGILLIRQMPEAEYARYTFALAVLAFALQSVAATFNRIFILMPQRGPGGDAFGRPMLLAQFVALAALALVGMPIAGRLGSLYVLVVALVGIACLYEFVRTTFQKRLDFKTFATMDLHRAALFGTLVLFAVATFGADTSAMAVVIAQAIAYLVVCGRVAFGLRKTILSPDSAGLREFARSFLDHGYPLLVVYFFLVGIFTQADIFMLTALGDDSMVASYGSAYRYYAILALALGSAHSVLLPMIQQAGTRQELDEMLGKHFRLLVVFAGAVLVSAWASGWFIPLVDAGKYPDAVPVFRILSVSIIVSFAFSPHVNLVLRHAQYRFLVLLVIASLAVALIGNYLLIPDHGAIGTAMATLLSAALLNVTIYLRSKALIEQTTG